MGGPASTLGFLLLMEEKEHPGRRGKGFRDWKTEGYQGEVERNMVECKTIATRFNCRRGTL